MSKREELLNSLEILTRSMDIPSYRRRSVTWLLKHLEKRNSKHKNYNKVMEILEELKNMGV